MKSKNWMDRDITFCDLKRCKRHKTCHRYEPKPQQGDSFFLWEKDFNPDKCEMYWGEQAKGIWDVLMMATGVNRHKSKNYVSKEGL